MEDVLLVESWDHLARVLVPFLVRVGAAALCGAMIGVERELRRKPAGLRTTMLICIGSAMYMAVGLLLADEAARTDPTRIAAQVVTGIGFLGAGAIIQAGRHVTGLTTAATIWVVAAIGLVAGAGFPALAFVSALLVLVILAALGVVEGWLLRHTGAGSRNRENV